MRLSILIKEALTNLFTMKLKTSLAILGIFVGTASVVATISGGELATQQALLQFQSLGTDLLSVSINSTSANNASPKISLKTAMNIKNISPDIISVAPYINIYAPTYFKGKSIKANVIGTTEQLSKIMKISLFRGRHVSHIDQYSFFTAIGDTIFQNIKKLDPTPIGNQIQIGKHLFTVVGVTKPWKESSSFIYTNLNESIFIPIQATQIISPNSELNNIIIKLKPHSDFDEIQEKIKHYFNKNTTDKKLYFHSGKEFIEHMKKQKQILTVFLGFIGCITLLVAGIGIMNIMLVSIAARRREIGIRLAVGAKRRDIQLLFFLEAIILSLLGGLGGIIAGIVISYLIAITKHWHFTLFYMPPIVGFCSSVLTGIFFGFYPAYKASRLDPIKILRGE